MGEDFFLEAQYEERYESDMGDSDDWDRFDTDPEIDEYNSDNAVIADDAVEVDLEEQYWANRARAGR